MLKVAIVQAAPVFQNLEASLALAVEHIAKAASQGARLVVFGENTVTNTGNGDAIILWSTVFPTSDGVVEFTPSFKVGGVYVVPPPNCN